MNLDEQIKNRVEELKNAGSNGPFVLIPTVYKHCLIPCHIKKCNCFPTVYERFTIISEEYKKGALADLNSEIMLLNERLSKYNENKNI